MIALPSVMVAPSGARRTKADHPALPITIAEIVQCAKECFAVGADGIHAHIRDKKDQHLLDAGIYRELIAELAHSVPKMAVQITTEAVGIYTPAQQRALVKAVKPAMVSVALREMQTEEDAAKTQEFYHFCAEASLAVQHILYSAEEFTQLLHWMRTGIVPLNPHVPVQLLWVLGRYHPNQLSVPQDLDSFATAILPDTSAQWDWAVCAFGYNEQACLWAAQTLGGKVRIGFENNLWLPNQQLAESNATQVRDFLSS